MLLTRYIVIKLQDMTMNTKHWWEHIWLFSQLKIHSNIGLSFSGKRLMSYEYHIAIPRALAA